MVVGYRPAPFVVVVGHVIGRGTTPPAALTAIRPLCQATPRQIGFLRHSSAASSSATAVSASAATTRRSPPSYVIAASAPAGSRPPDTSRKSRSRLQPATSPSDRHPLISSSSYPAGLFR